MNFIPILELSNSAVFKLVLLSKMTQAMAKRMKCLRQSKHHKLIRQTTGLCMVNDG